MIKTIKKTTDGEVFDLREENFTFRAETVQGAKVGYFKNAVLIASPRRFKLFVEKIHLVKILSLTGEGHFKWAKGETPFHEGDCFEIVGEGEYELTANGKFMVIKE